MAIYEIRKHESNAHARTGEVLKVEHDKTLAVNWANEKTIETGELLDVVEIKHVHLTSTMANDDMGFF